MFSRRIIGSSLLPAPLDHVIALAMAMDARLDRLAVFLQELIVGVKHVLARRARFQPVKRVVARRDDEFMLILDVRRGLPRMQVRS